MQIVSLISNFSAKAITEISHMKNIHSILYKIFGIQQLLYALSVSATWGHSHVPFSLFFVYYSISTSWIPRLTSPQALILTNNHQRKYTNWHTRSSNYVSCIIQKKVVSSCSAVQRGCPPPAKHDKRAMLHPDRAIWAVTLQPAIPHKEYTDTLQSDSWAKWHAQNGGYEGHWNLWGQCESYDSQGFCVKIYLYHIWDHREFFKLPKLHSHVRYKYIPSPVGLVNWNFTPKYKLTCSKTVLLRGKAGSTSQPTVGHGNVIKCLFRPRVQNRNLL